VLDEGVETVGWVLGGLLEGEGSRRIGGEAVRREKVEGSGGEEKETREGWRRRKRRKG